jgi:hypothetical protein
VDGLASQTDVWRTDDPCPVCAAGLFLVGRSEPAQVLECRLCGWSETWDLTADPTNDNGSRGDAR